MRCLPPTVCITAAAVYAPLCVRSCGRSTATIPWRAACAPVLNTQEWWNAATLAEYWKLWNLPVHKWMLRTIFFPLVRRGAPRLASLLFVFFISAVMHELAVGVPLRMLRGWAFWGMMLQVRRFFWEEGVCVVAGLCLNRTADSQRVAC